MDAYPIHFARVDFRNDDRVFGIKTEDRFLHVYVIGKTGTGKSTLLETMALQDLERGNGFVLIDPHGDLVARVAARVPTSHRVIYLNATDPTQPYGYNPLRHVSADRIAHAPCVGPHLFENIHHAGSGERHGTHFAQRTHGPLGTTGRNAPRRASYIFRQ